MTRPEGCGSHPCGSRQAYELAGCRLDGCRLMMILHTRGDPPQNISGARRHAEPYAQILRSLFRAGYSFSQLAERSDHSAVTLRNIALGATAWVYPDTAKAIEGLVVLLPSESEVSA